MKMIDFPEMSFPIQGIDEVKIPRMVRIRQNYSRDRVEDLQGSLDEGLSENGRRALTRAAFCPAHVYVSTAARARETAGIVFPEAEQLLCHDLREMDFGAFEGRGWWEMEEDADYRAWVDGGCAGRCPGGEDRAEFTRRVCGCFEKILKAESGENGGEDNKIGRASCREGLSAAGILPLAETLRLRLVAGL